MDEWDELIAGVGKSLRGRPKTEITVGQIRPLEEDDLLIAAQLRADPSKRLPTSTPPELLRLRTRHHMIAQLLAVGMKPKDIALKTGYSISRISILQLDPAFKELLANYTAEQDNLTVDVKERLRHLSMDSIDVIQSRFDDDPTQFSNKELMDLAELTLDRTGHGKSAVVTHTYGIDPETAELLRQNRTKPQVANLLEGELIDTAAISGRAAPSGAPSGSEVSGESGEFSDGRAPQQLDLFESEDQAAGGSEISEVPFGTPEDYSEGEAERDPEVGTGVPEEVREDVTARNVVQFPRIVERSAHPA